MPARVGIPPHAPVFRTLVRLQTGHDVQDARVEGIRVRVLDGLQELRPKEPQEGLEPGRVPVRYRVPLGRRVAHLLLAKLRDSVRGAVRGNGEVLEQIDCVMYSSVRHGENE